MKEYFKKHATPGNLLIAIAVIYFILMDIKDRTAQPPQNPTIIQHDLDVVKMAGEIKLLNQTVSTLEQKNIDYEKGIILNNTVIDGMDDGERARLRAMLNPPQ